MTVYQRFLGTIRGKLILHSPVSWNRGVAKRFPSQLIMPQQEPIVINFQLCVALYDNVAESADELSFKGGDVLTVLETVSPGLEGWWICGFKGRQGICPSNRLRMMTEAEQVAVRDSKRKSWQHYVKIPGVVAKATVVEPATYDSPAQRHTVPTQEQYDVPSAQVLPCEESYDVPKPVIGAVLGPRGAASLTPSSSISSLTTDSNRSSLVQQDYDVPRPSRVAQAQGVYDVPKGGELSLDMTSALEWLGRLEADVTGAISRLLGLATAGWRTKAKLDARMIELKGSVGRLGSSLHDLTIFTHAVLASHHETGLGTKLGHLVAALNKADLQVKECIRGLDGFGWTAAALAIDETDTSTEKETDHLDKLVQTAAALTDDIRAIASFIQGNSTLLFKRASAQSPSDSQYMNLSGGGRTEEYVEPNSREPTNGSAPSELNSEREEPPVIELGPLSSSDRKIVELFAGHYWCLANQLSQSIEAFLSTVTNNQPPKSFLSQCKVVVTTVNKLLMIGEAIERSLEPSPLRTELANINRLIAEGISGLVLKTTAASAHFPSVRAVQRMVDAVLGLSAPPQRFSMSLQAAVVSA